MALGKFFKKVGKGFKKLVKVAAPMALSMVPVVGGMLSNVAGGIIESKEAKKAQKKYDKQQKKLLESAGAVDIGQAPTGSTHATYPLSAPSSIYSSGSPYAPMVSWNEPAPFAAPPTSQQGSELPPWLIPVAIVAGIILLVFLARK